MGTPAKHKSMPNPTDPRWPPGRRRPWTYTRNHVARTMFIRVVSVVSMVITAVPPAGAICPSKCLCNDKLLEARCEGSNLEVVPIQLNPEIKNLKLNNNKITNIHLTLSFYTHLNELDLSYNKIHSLGTKNFEFQDNLIKLNLSHNHVKQLHKDSFKGLKTLYVLDLSYNNIEEINERTSFKDLSKLQELNLASNNIYIIETGVFDYLIELRRLVLSDNQLLRVPDSAINTLNNLMEVDLNYNLIEDLSFPSNLRNLQILKLRSNVISTFGNDTFNSLYHLKYLDLSDNNLTQVPTYQLSKLNYLEHLNLSSNLFTRLGPNSFLNLYKLTEVLINNVGTLSKLDSKFLLDNFNLQHVSLANNGNLKYLPKFIFLNKPHLKHVSIAGNDLSTLDASDLPLDQLETLKLAGNPFRCNCSLLWLWILKERQVDHNCSCAEPSCLESCIETLPKTEKLRGREYSEEEDSGSASDQSSDLELDEDRTAKFQSLTYNKDMFPIILDLEKIYCEDEERARRVQLKFAPKSDFDCTMTWLLILTIAILIVLFLFFMAVVVYIVKIRCKRKTKNPVENFINATKTYEDTHHTYYRYGQALQHNGDVFEILKTDKNGYGEKGATNMYIKSPVLKENISYPFTMNTFKNVDPGVGNIHSTLAKPCRKQHSHSNTQLPDVYNDNSGFSINNYVPDTNIYQEPFSGPVLPKLHRPPHVVYV